MKKAGSYWVPDRETIQLDALERGAWQGDHLEAALMHTKRRRWAVDGGAHIGSWSIAMAPRFKLVHAFEPCRETYECLERNISEHGHTNIVPHEFALGKDFGAMAMEEDGKYSTGGNTGGRYLVPGEGVSVRPLDSFSAVIRGLDFLKLDVEGFELFALQGGEKMIRAHHPVVMIEVKHRIAARQGLRAEAAGEFLATLGYVPIDRIGSDEVWSHP